MKCIVTEPAPFEHPAWIEAARDWVHVCVPNATGIYVQERASSWGRLLRFATDADPIWLKAIRPGTNELELTLALSQWEPKRCLPVFAHRTDWGAWLSHHVRGRALTFADGCDLWARMVRSMAALQVRSAARAGELLALGCRDYRAHVLLQRLDWLLDLLERLMAEQPVCPPSRLGRHELQQVGEQARRSLSAAVDAALPDVLTHTDWGPHNVLVEDGGGCRLIDWAGACLAPAPVGFTWLLVKFERRWAAYHAWRPDLRDAYGEAWRNAVHPRTRDVMRQHASMLAMLVRSCRDADLYMEQPLQHHTRATILRSVARLMFNHSRKQ